VGAVRVPPVQQRCGLDIAVKDGRMVGVRGRATDVVNHGRLGPKGLYGSTGWAHAGDRLTEPRYL
jgi:anaerobic selenocysteine-containing dehydrogenase